MRIALVTCNKLPEPDVDEPLLLEQLGALGADVRMAAWDNPSEDWRDTLAVIRSTWNYYLDRLGFLRWVDLLEERGHLLNPPKIVRWNSHKKYLVDLASEGFPVVPTECVQQGSGVSLQTILSAKGWTEAVFKPAISAGSYRTFKVKAHNLAEAQPQFEQLLNSGDVLVQPYVSSVEGYGERSLVFIDGELTHSIRKSPRFSNDAESVSEALPIDSQERDVADRILKRVDSSLLYARVDLARDESGQPMLMELELIEPSLFLRQSDMALHRFAEAIVRRATG
jgi:hypothetical protein